ncbi:MAG: hypothetical protein AABX52_00375 [Nanoarchaeota archaeon]
MVNQRESREVGSDVGVYLVYAMILVGMLILGLVMYELSLHKETPKTKVFSNLTPHIELPSKTKIGVEPFVEPIVWSFEDTYKAVRHLDKKYETAGANFHTESIRKGIWVRANSVDDYIRDILILTARISNNTISNQTKSIGYFLLARKQMLLSEKYFQQGLSYGMHGVFNKDYNCEDREIIKQANMVYNLSNINGWRAMANLDRALASYDNAREYIGVNTPDKEHRPAFYDNIFVDIGYFVNTNTQALHDYCDGTRLKKDVSTNSIAKGNLSHVQYLPVTPLNLSQPQL